MMLGLLLAACAGAASTTGDSGLCQAAPVITYANFGQGFLKENCQPCHATSSPNRNGAPESVTFDSLDDALAHADRILAVVPGNDARMPPAGGVSEDDQYRVEVWLTCWGL